MKRINSRIFNRFDGKRVYSSNKIGRVPISNRDIYITSNESTTLDSLALKYYNDSTKWYIIARANNLGMGYRVPQGIQLRIPINVNLL